MEATKASQKTRVPITSGSKWDDRDISYLLQDHDKISSIHTLWWFNIAIEHGGSFHSYVNVYQRVHNLQNIYIIILTSFLHYIDIPYPSIPPVKIFVPDLPDSLQGAELKPRSRPFPTCKYSRCKISRSPPLQICWQIWMDQHPMAFPDFQMIFWGMMLDPFKDHIGSYIFQWNLSKWVQSSHHVPSIFGDVP